MSRQSYLVPSFLIGIASFFYLFGLLRAAGIGGAYDHPGGDLAQHIAGAYAYLDGRWSFPLFYTDRINAPAGANIIFTDSAPFAGVIAKIINSITGLRWNYIGTWFFVLWVLQPVSGAFLARQLDVKGWVAPTLIGIIALTCPFFLMRHSHLALSSHFLILFSLGFYFKDVKSRKLSAYYWAAILGVAIWTHAYLYAICFAIFGAAVSDIALFKRSMAFRTIAIGSAVFAFTIFLAVIGGYGSGSGAADGYSIYSADLLSMVWPTESTFLHFKSPFTSEVRFEGNNYLGLGGELAIVLAIFIARKSPYEFLRKHPFLSVVLACCAVYAVGNIIRVAGIPIFEYPVPENLPPYSILRASGRIMWPLSYILIFISLAIIARARQLKLAAYIALAALMIIQVTDMLGPVMKIKQGSVGKDRTELAQLISQAERVSYLIPIDCLSAPQGLSTLTEINWIAAKTGKQTDSAHLARHSEPLVCDFKQVSKDPGTLSLAPVAAIKYIELPREQCSQIDDVYACGAIVAQNSNLTKLPKSEPFRLSMTADQLVKFTQVGYLENGVLKNRGSGVIFYGPYVTVPAGEYKVDIDADISNTSSVIVDVVSDVAKVKHFEYDVAKSQSKSFRFKLDDIVRKLEVRMTSKDGGLVSIRGYTMIQLD